MPSRTRQMHQDATYWAPPSDDGLGNMTFGAATAIKCRWQQRRELFTDAEGNQRVSSAVVYVDRPLESEGYLYLGTSAAADPRTIGGWEVKNIGASPNLRATETLNKVWL